MVSLNRGHRITSFFAPLAALVLLSGCAEVRTMISVIFNGATSLSTSAFEVDDMKSGNKVTCAILGDKSLRCLGPGLRGSLGRFYGAPVSSLKDVKQTALGKGFTCAIVGEKSELFCFGNNDKGQLGNSSVTATIDPVPVLDTENSNAPLIEVKQVVAGDNHACALLKNGRAICWGDNLFGQAGNPSTSGVGVKTVVENERGQKPFPNIHEIFAGANSTCIIAKEDFSPYCFGERYGSTRTLNWGPEKIDLSGSIGTLSNIKQIGLGRGFGCALSKGAQVYCWGRNDLNQLGALVNLPGMTKATLVQVTYPSEQALSKVDKLAVGENHACALHRDEKTVYCWGDNRFGQLGNTSLRGLPEQVALGSNNLTLKGVRELAVGPDRTCIISSRDEVFCWGNGAHGILGSEKVLSPYPVRALDANGEMLNAAAQIAVGTDHSCIIDTSQRMYCFGINEFGQLGSKNVSGQVVQSDLQPVTKVTAIETYGMRTCMVYGSNQGVACFGDRDIDNINQKQELNSFVPEEMKKGMSAYKGALGVSVGKSHICVITSNQQVECLGDGSKGQLGGGETQALKFAQVLDDKRQPLKDVWQIKSREDWTCALKQETGAIWCWGEWNGSDRWLTARQLPVGGKPSSDFIQMTMNLDQICGVHGIDRGLYCTQLGEKSADKLDFKQVFDAEGKPMKKMLSITSGLHHGCALDDDGRTYCWGANDVGQLGLRTLKDALHPLKVTFKNEHLRKASRISAGDRHTCVASSEEAAIFCFGENFFGGLNSPDAIEYPL
jgi:alpha-tubulin suppressor-like RCC1 family protein